VQNPFGSKTVLASKSSTGERGLHDSWCPDISADGRFVVFVSAAGNLAPDDTNFSDDLFLRDQLNRTTTRINVTSDGQQSSDGVGLRRCPSVSGHGRYVVYVSRATDLDPADSDTRPDVYLYDRVLQTTRVVTATRGPVRRSGGTRRGSLPTVITSSL